MIKESSNRIRTLLAAILLLGTAAVAAAQENGQDDGQQQPQEDPVVLRAGDYEETRSEFESRFEIALRGVAASEGVEFTEQVRNQLEAFKASFLDQRVTEVALRQAAEERGITVSDEEIDERVEAVKSSLPEGESIDSLLELAGFESEDQLRTMIRETEYIQRGLDAIEAEIEITDEQVEEYYEANAQQFTTPEQVCARHILVETSDEAEQLLSELEGGADFAALADEHSTDAASQGGELGCFGRGRMVPPFEEAAFSAPVGEPVGPVESQFGQHLILVYDKQESESLPIEEVRPAVEQQLRQGQLAQRVDEIVANADVEVFPERLDLPEADPVAPAQEPADPAEQPAQPDSEESN